MKKCIKLNSNFMRYSFIIIVIPLMFFSCHNPVDSSKKEVHKANAGGDQTSYVGSYVNLDASKTKLPVGEQIAGIKWDADSTNPAKVLINDEFAISTQVGFDKEGKYKFKLKVTSSNGDIYTDEIVVTVNRTQIGLIVDPNLEILIRYKLNYPVGYLFGDKLQIIDSINHNDILINNLIHKLDGIEYCSNLSFLNAVAENIVDLKPLSNLTKLEYLDLDQNYTIEDISPINKLINLKTLILFSNPIKDISGLSNLINLKELDLNLTPISDITPLTNLVNLEILSLGGTLSNLSISLEPLRNLTKLKQLTLYDHSITDITSLQNLTDLIYLALSYNNLTKISAVSNMKKLIRLEVDQNNVNDISGIKNLVNLDYFSANNNQINDISELQYLPKIHMIALSGNNIEDISPLVNNPNIGNGVYIFLGNNPLNQKSIDEYIPALIARGVTIYR